MIYSFAELKEKIRVAPAAIVDEIGRKALSLIEMSAFSVSVPNGYCVSANCCQEFLQAHQLDALKKNLDQPGLTKERQECCLREISEAILRLPVKEDLFADIHKLFAADHESYAIRSSGSKEDLHNASFAGQYVTKLNVRGPAAIIAAIKSCWASMFTFRVFHYCQEHGLSLEELGMAVIIQKMVPAEKSGVVFTVNPITGVDTHMLIESVQGLGESLVGGEADPDRFVYDWYQRRLIEKKISQQKFALFCPAEGNKIERSELPPEQTQASSLFSEEIEAIAAAALKVQSGYGFPVDIEWAIADGIVYLVQARPITSLDFSGIKGQWSTADLKDGGISSSVCSQLMYSLYKMVWDKLMPEYLMRTGLIDKNDGVRSDFFYGRMYWAAGAVKEGLKRIIGFNEREFDESLGIEVGYEGDGHVTGLSFASVITGIKVMISLEKSFKYRLNFNRRNFAGIKNRIDEIDKLCLDTLSEDDFFAFFTTLIKKDYFLVEGSYFQHIFDNANVQTTFRDVIKNYPEINYLNLVIGLKNLSHLKPIDRLWKISRFIRKNPDAFSYWQNSKTSDIISDLQSHPDNFNLIDLIKYLKDFKYLSTHELDITIANYGEDPTFVINTVKQQIQLEDDCDPLRLNENQHCRFLEEKEKLMQAAGIFSRKSVEKKLERMREFLWWREELRDQSTRMYDQIRRFCLKAGFYLCRRGILSRPEEIFFFCVDDLFAVINGKIESPTARDLLQRNQTYYRSFRNFTNPDDIGFKMAQQPEIEKGRDFISGIACSSGVVSGRLRLVKDIHDTNRIEKGDILVTRFTDPAWTPLFSLISAVVTETGGVLSHAAVIAREYGIPAVLAVKGIFEKFKDGDEIIVDGNNGRIYCRNSSVQIDPASEKTKVEMFSFTAKNQLEDFVNFALELYRNDSRYIAPFATSIKDELNPQKNPFFNYGSGMAFLIRENAAILGRCAAFINPKMNRGGKNYGLIGYFEVSDNYAAAAKMLDTAIAWLKENGCNEIVGPMNFSIWGRYRLRIDNFDRMPFYSENYNKSYYPDFFLRYGFRVVRRWSSRKLDIRNPEVADKLKARLNKYLKRYEKSLAMGYSFEFNRKENFTAIMAELHELVTASFVDHHLFYPLSAEEFAFIFSGLEKIVQEKQILLARKDGKVHGFMIHSFDYGQALAKMHGQTSLKAKLAFWFNKKENCLLHLFIAVSPEAKCDGSGVSAAMAYLAGTSFLADPRIESFVHCTMYEGNRSNVMSAGVGETIGTYALFAKEI